MKIMSKIIVTVILLTGVSCFWDAASTTVRGIRTDTTPRVSFFRWQWVYSENMRFWFYWWDWWEIGYRRRLNVVAGISIDFLPLSTATILNRRVLVTSYNYMDPYINRQQDMRIWALGRAGQHNTPFRYRVYRVTRVIPLSINPEQCHGPRCIHKSRHDVAIIVSLDQMYVFPYFPKRYHYAYRALIVWKYATLSWDIWSAGSGFEYTLHILENYKIFFAVHKKDDIVDCSIYLPKWWGKFICIKNAMSFPGVQNGGGLYSGTTYIFGLGAFGIRYNEDRIVVFTDLRYYHNKIHHYAYIWPGQYYEYAYPQWSVYTGWFYDSSYNVPYIPSWQVKDDLYPLGK